MTLPIVKEPTRTRTTSVMKNSSKAKPALPPNESPRGSSKTSPHPTRTKTADRRRPTIVSPQAGSKTARILALLKRPQGVGLKELLKATGGSPTQSAASSVEPWSGGWD
jgi:hypothetical protein